MIGLNEDNNLVMVIQRNSLTQTTFDRHYADNLLSIPGNAPLQDELKDALGIEGDYMIPAGDYPITKQVIEGEEFLVVNFGQ